MPPEDRKIPSCCRQCGERLRSGGMEWWLDICEKRGWDPIAKAFAQEPLGINCMICGLGNLLNLPTFARHAGISTNWQLAKKTCYDL